MKKETNENEKVLEIAKKMDEINAWMKENLPSNRPRAIAAERLQESLSWAYISLTNFVKEEKGEPRKN